jgi:hypothetical protein
MAFDFSRSERKFLKKLLGRTIPFKDINKEHFRTMYDLGLVEVYFSEERLVHEVRLTLDGQLQIFRQRFRDIPKSGDILLNEDNTSNSILLNEKNASIWAEKRR